jgi:hypothetical protein
LGTLPRLEVLEVALNGIVTLDPGGGFLSLAILDLSFNSVAPDEITKLGE